MLGHAKLSVHSIFHIRLSVDLGNTYFGESIPCEFTCRFPTPRWIIVGNPLVGQTIVANAISYMEATKLSAWSA